MKYRGLDAAINLREDDVAGTRNNPGVSCFQPKRTQSREDRLVRSFSGIWLLVMALVVAGCSGSNNAPDGNAQLDQTFGSPAEGGYEKETLLDEARDVFGAGAEGMGEAVEAVFSKMGEPIAYIKAEEAGGGLVVGLRYGGGTMNHKIEGETPIHWTGPSIGLDAGGEVAKVFALVYNLHDVQEIYSRFAAIEGQFYYIGGAGITYIQHDDIVIALIRLGVGLRGQASVGYYKFSKNLKLVPF